MLKQLTAVEFLGKFDPTVHARIIELAKTPDAIALAVFENITFDSSLFGQRTAYVVGPNNTFKTLEQIDGKWVNDLPSQRMHATSYVTVADLLAEPAVSPPPVKRRAVRIAKAQLKDAARSVDAAAISAVDRDGKPYTISEPAVPTPKITSFVGQVKTPGDKDWVGNQLRFATYVEAAEYVANLAGRWTQVERVNVAGTSDPVNAEWRDGRAHLHSDKPDVVVTNDGSVVSFAPQTPAATAWIEDNVQSESWQWLGKSLVVDHRYAAQLVQGMLDAGLTVA